MPRLDDSRPALLAALRDRYGDLAPTARPGADEGQPFERIAVEFLARVADARIVQAALVALAAEGLLDPATLAKADPVELESLFQERRVRLSARGFAPLLRLARWAAEADFDAEAAALASTEALRESWRGLKGISPATADALLLFALDRPTYPVDRGSYRVFARHGWIDATADYDEARSALEGVAPDEAPALARLSLGLQRLARELCKPGQPRCDRCPLQPLLPEGGPLEVE